MRKGAHTAYAVVIAITAMLASGCDNGNIDPIGEQWTRLGGIFSSKTVKKERGYFYRIEASYSLKDTGEPIDFDFVVACGAKVTHWRYTGPSTHVSTHPLVMIKAAPNGGAVLLRAYRELCERGVRWQQVSGEYGAPDDLLPFIIWFDDVNDLSFGWGYATEDAYYNTNSRLNFHGAAATEASYDEWKAWRRKAAKEYKQVGQLPGPWGYSYTNGPKQHTRRVKALHANGENITNSCHGYIRVPAPQEVIEKIWASAPDYNPAPQEGRYFTIVAKDGWLYEIINNAGPVFNGRKLQDYFGNPNFKSLGAINRNNSGFIRTSASVTRLFSEHYPILPRSKSTEAPMTEPADVYPRRLLVSDEWKGMLACGGDYFVPGPDHLAVTKVDPARPKDDMVVIIRNQSFDPDWKQKQFPLYVNDEVIVENLLDQEYGGTAEHIFIIDREGYILARRPWGFGGP